MLTNLAYIESDPMLDIRLERYVDIVVPQLRGQTNTDFDIALRVNKPTLDKIRHYLDTHGCKDIITFTEDHILFLGTYYDKSEFYNYGGESINKYSTWENIHGLEKYDIQTSYDSDDYVSKDYIQTVKDIAMGHENKEPLHIHFQPIWLHEATKTTGRMEFRYNKYCGSAFYSIYCPQKDKEYIFCRVRSHANILNMFKYTILVPEGKCWIGVNENNVRTRWVPPKTEDETKKVETVKEETNVFDIMPPMGPKRRC